MGGQIWLITGAQASGKSTVADLLARQFAHSVHIRGGQFYRWAVSGWVHFDDRARQEEARRLLDLRYRLSAVTAAEYADAGFVAVVQDNIYGPDVGQWLDRVAPRTRYLVVLRPSIAALTARDAGRRAETGKVAYRAGYTIAENDADLAKTPRDLGLWLDTSALDPQETVLQILARKAEAEIG